jgi:hypothetical protein
MAGELADFDTFAKEEKARVEAYAKSQRNEKSSEWYADKKLQFKRESMQQFFEKKAKKRAGHKFVAAKRAADTIASYDRAYKFRIQSRLDNVPRQDAELEMDQYYWGQIHLRLQSLFGK